MFEYKNSLIMAMNWVFEDGNSVIMAMICAFEDENSVIKSNDLLVRR